MRRQLDEFQVFADGEIFTVGNGQENFVAYRFTNRVGSFTRLRPPHVSSCQNNPPLYWNGTLETPHRYGPCAIDHSERRTPETWRRETLYLGPLVHVCRASNIEKYHAALSRIRIVRFERTCQVCRDLVRRYEVVLPIIWLALLCAAELRQKSFRGKSRGFAPSGLPLSLLALAQ